MQDARILAICKLHPARIAVNQTADAAGQDNGLVQLPLPGGKDSLYGISFAGGIRKKVDNKFFHKIVMEEATQEVQCFRIRNFCQVDKGIAFSVFFTKKV